MKAIHFIGRRFGRLIVREQAAHKGAKRRWFCDCDCGGTSIAHTYDLTSGKHTSCGCLHRERVTRHDLARSPTYRVWGAMHQRCTNPNATGYRYYGGRGITVCERWRKFENFLADMGEQPAKRMSIDRINVNGNYEPSNCRWLSMAKQQLNRRNNRLITLGGLTQTVKEWCIDLKIDEELFRGRLKLGWTPDKIITKPVIQSVQDPCTGRWKSGHS